MANGKIVKYKKHYKITLEGKTDTKNPNETPMFVKYMEGVLNDLVRHLDYETSWNNVTMKEVKK